MSFLFLSHSTKDRGIVLQVSSQLQTLGYNVWLAPDSIPPGANFNSAIVDAIRGCVAFCVLVSAASNGSENVEREVAIADGFGKRIIPIRLEAVQPASGLVFYLSLPQWVEWQIEGALALKKIALALAARRQAANSVSMPSAAPIAPAPAPRPPTTTARAPASAGQAYDANALAKASRDGVVKAGPSRTIDVDRNGGGEVRTISEAVRLATPGTTIRVAPGAYDEQVQLDKTLRIVAKDPANRPSVFQRQYPALYVSGGASVVENIDFSSTERDSGVWIVSGGLTLIGCRIATLGKPPPDTEPARPCVSIDDAIVNLIACRLGPSVDSGVTVRKNSTGVIVGNRFEQIAGVGAWAGGLSKVLVCDNELVGVGSNSLVAAQSTLARFERNRITSPSPGSPAMAALSMSKATFLGNEIVAAAGNGFCATDEAGGVLQANRFIDCGSRDRDWPVMWIGPKAKTEVLDNTVVRPRSDAWYASEGAPLAQIARNKIET